MAGRPRASRPAGPSSSGRSVSAPRPEGAVLVRADDGRIAGSVSGGCVEGAAAGEIERARRDGHSRVIRYGISDEEAWDVGLACGGTIDVLVEPAVPAAAVAAASRERGSAVATVLPRRRPAGRRSGATSRAPAPRRRTRSWSTPTAGSTAPSARPPPTPSSRRPPPRRSSAARSRTVTIGDRQVFVEAFPTKPRLVIVGAVEVARSLAVYARELGYAVVVVDGRASFATPSGSRRTGSTASSSAGRTRSPTRSGSAATTPSPS